MSPEMESPKLLWLREHLPETWRRAASLLRPSRIFSSTRRPAPTCARCAPRCASGRIWATSRRGAAAARSGGDAGEAGSDSVGRWDDSFFREIGLGDLVDEGYRRIGRRIRPMGEPVGAGLARAGGERARPRARHRGRRRDHRRARRRARRARARASTAPHAITPEVLETRLALIGGTSSCHMAVSREARFIPGVWGPYFSAMVPGLWLTEGGQSATGSLIDHVVFGHARAEELRQEVARERQDRLRDFERAFKSAGGRSRPRRSRPRSRAICTCCRTFTATARRAPTRRCAARSPASSCPTRSTTSRCSISPPCRRSRTARATSSRR